MDDILVTSMKLHNSKPFHVKKNSNSPIWIQWAAIKQNTPKYMTGLLHQSMLLDIL